MTSRVRVRRPSVSMQDGVLTTVWVNVPGLTNLPCRIEVGLFRPGKDFPLPPQAGRSPDRIAVYWIASNTDLRPGDHMECISGPVVGTWQVRVAPDATTGMSQLHHYEGQIVELATSIVAGRQVS